MATNQPRHRGPRAGGGPSPVRGRVAVADSLDGVAVDFSTEIKNLRTTMASVREVLDLEKLKKQIAELEEQSAAPDLWDDVEAAQKITSALFAVRLAVMVPLYLAHDVTALGIAKIALGWPLYVLTLAAMVLLLLTGETPLDEHDPLLHDDAAGQERVDDAERAQDPAQR